MNTDNDTKTGDAGAGDPGQATGAGASSSNATPSAAADGADTTAAASSGASSAAGTTGVDAGAGGAAADQAGGTVAAGDVKGTDQPTPYEQVHQKLLEHVRSNPNVSDRAHHDAFRAIATEHGVSHHPWLAEFEDLLESEKLKFLAWLAEIREWIANPANHGKVENAAKDGVDPKPIDGPAKPAA
jgi:hypothetical protein